MKIPFLDLQQINAPYEAQFHQQLQTLLDKGWYILGEEVLQFVGKHMELPKHFMFNHSSMDCYDCTAYRKETKDITAYRKMHFPKLDEKYQQRNTQLNKALFVALGD